MKYNTEEIVDEEYDESRILLRCGDIFDYKDCKDFREKDMARSKRRYNGSDELLYKRRVDEYMEDWGEYVGEFR